MRTLLWCSGLVLVVLLASACAPEPAPEVSDETTVAPSGSESDPTGSTPDDSPSETAEAGAELNLDEQGRALRGFDAVAYHLQGEAVAGQPEFTHVWQGVPWLFASAENRDAFAAEPQRFAPANGGYCTFGVVLKRKLDVDPQIFLVEDESLLLFLNREVQEKFLGDKDGNLQLIRSHWPEIASVHPDVLAAEGT